MLRDLVEHKAWASSALLNAIWNCRTAADDEALRTLLHHIILANRFWLFSSLGQPFAVDEESRVPDSLPDVSGVFRATHEIEAAWMSRSANPIWRSGSRGR